MSLVKEDYQTILTFLSRQEVAGMQGGHDVRTLIPKIEAKITNWNDPVDQEQVVAAQEDAPVVVTDFTPPWENDGPLAKLASARKVITKTVI